MQLCEYPDLGERFRQERLPCGLRLRVVEKPGFARTFAVFAADCGSIDTTWLCGGVRKTVPAGTAHYLEHKMFDMPDVHVMDAFTRTGASPNAFTSYGVTAYYFDGTDSFYENLELLLRFVSTPYFTQQSVEKERGIIGQEIRMYEDSPGACLGENLYRALYRSHPLRVPILGSHESIARITPETLYDFHEAFYDTANMLLFAAGDIDPVRVRETAERVLPASRGLQIQKDHGPQEELLPAESRVEQQREVAMPMFAAGFKCAVGERGPQMLRRSLLAELSCDILAGESSELYTRLYRRGLIDSSFSAGFSALPQAAMVTVSGDSASPDLVLEELLRQAERLCSRGLDSQQLERAKRSAYGQRLRNLDSFESVCYNMLDCCLDGSEYLTFPEFYKTVTEDEVLDFIRTSIDARHCALSVIVPKE